MPNVGLLDASCLLRDQYTRYTDPPCALYQKQRRFYYACLCDKKMRGVDRHPNSDRVMLKNIFVF